MLLRMKSCCMYLLLLVTWVAAYDFPGRLTSDESVELQTSCGLKPLKTEVSVTSRPKRSAYSELTNRTAAPFVVNIGCSAVLISKRHVLTAAHCIYPEMEFGETWTWEFFAYFAFTCNGCTQEYDRQRVEITDVFYLEQVRVGFPYAMKRDIAVLVLKEDVEFTDLYYPACLAGYLANLNDTFVQFGYGMSSPEEIAETGFNRAGRLQTISAKRLSGIHFKDDVYMRGFYPTNKSQIRPGDSGSGFIHTRNGIQSVYSITSYFSKVTTDMGTMRVSAHLFWISQVTGINVADEDDEFDGYFYPLIYKDNRKKQTYEAGARHPNKIVPEKTYFEHAVNRLTNEKMCAGNVFIFTNSVYYNFVYARCNLYVKYFSPCGSSSNEKGCQEYDSTDDPYFISSALIRGGGINANVTKRDSYLFKITQTLYDRLTNDFNYKKCPEDLNAIPTNRVCILEKYNV